MYSKSRRVRGTPRDQRTRRTVPITVFSGKRSQLSRTCKAQIEAIIDDSITSFSRTDFKIEEVSLDKNPEIFEKMRIFALPTVIIGNQAIVGIPDHWLIKEILEKEQRSVSR